MLLSQAFMGGVTAVCRGWRSLRNTVKSPLFTHLNLLLDFESHLSVRKATRIRGWLLTACLHSTTLRLNLMTFCVYT